MRRVFPLFLLLLVPLATLPTQARQPEKQSAKVADWPKGDLLKLTFDQSKIFPGTTRQVTIYVPKQYDGKTPACVHINQDGVQFKAPEVFDELIHKKELPVLIGVFIMHGIVKAPDEKIAQNRFNRSFEYDGLGDHYARFLLEEILPLVEKQKTLDGREIILSKDGNDRSIGGSSSGAICAFTAAWERPDQFSRVFSSIGTYVGLRGGNNYATLIRKYEPKPIRVFLQDGANDLNIYGGDWWMANQEMERSLTFAGYEVKHSWDQGKHNNEEGTKIFPEAMRWLWKDHPKPIKTGLGSPQLKNILIENEGWKLVGEGYKFTEAQAVNDMGEMFFNDIPEAKTYKVGLDGKVSLYQENSKKANGMHFGPDGKRYVVATETQQVLAYDAENKPSVVAEGIAGNDIVVRQDGGIYVTAPNRDLLQPQAVYYISPRGEKKQVDTGLQFPNGVTLSTDQTLLYVAEARSHWVWSYQIQPDGSLKYKQRYGHLHSPDSADNSGADGLRCDRDGRLHVATRLGVQVCDQLGRVNCIIPTPNGRCANLCFGGANFDILYATCGDKVYSRKVKAKGANGFQAPIKPPQPGL